MLGSYVEYGTDSEQFAWLQQDLASVDRHRTPWVVVGMHAPWYAPEVSWRSARALSITRACPGATCGCSMLSFVTRALVQFGYTPRAGMLSLRSHRESGITAAHSSLLLHCRALAVCQAGGAPCIGTGCVSFAGMVRSLHALIPQWR